MRPLLCLILSLLLAPLAFAQRVNFDTGLHESTPYAAPHGNGAPFLVPCAPDDCSETSIVLVSTYTHTCTIRNLTGQSAVFEGSWLTTHYVSQDPAGEDLVLAVAHGSSFGSSPLIALGPNDGLPGGSDEQTVTFTLTQPMTVGEDTFVYELDAAPFRDHVQGRPAHRLYYRSEFWWSLSWMNDQPIQPGQHWPFAVDVLSTQGELFGQIRHHN